MNQVTSTGHRSGDIGASALLELVDKLWYLCDMLSVDGDADAVEARIRIIWNAFTQLVPSLTNMDISLITREGDCTAVVCKVVCCMEGRPGL